MKEKYKILTASNENDWIFNAFFDIFIGVIALLLDFMWGYMRRCTGMYLKATFYRRKRSLCMLKNLC